MTKRRKSLEEDAEQYIEALWQIHDNTQDTVAKRYVRMLARDLKGMALIVDTVLRDHAVKPKSRMGRHARATEREQQVSFDLDCYMTTELLRHDNLTWEKAIAAVAEDLHVAPETVRKARSRAKKVLSARAQSSGIKPADSYSKAKT